MTNTSVIEKNSKARHSFIDCEEKVDGKIIEQNIGMVMPVVDGYLATSGVTSAAKTFDTEGEAKTYLIHLYDSYKR
ncbi:hypothetical protein CN918_25450 [Priestia megaterium]|nr:hypothetical protein CN918_25450 [Priestia megaterium]